MTARPALSIIIPTQGRVTLRHALGSIRIRPAPDDIEVIVVADTHGPLLSDVRRTCDLYGAVYLEHDAGHHGYGHPQLMIGYRAATGAYVAVLGDDDEYLPGALQTIVDVTAALDPPCPALFRIEQRLRSVDRHPERARPLRQLPAAQYWRLRVHP